MGNIGDKAQAAKEKVQQTAQAAKEKTQQAAHATKEKAQDTTGQARETAQSGKDNSAGFLQQTGEKVKGMAQSATDEEDKDHFTTTTRR